MRIIAIVPILWQAVQYKPGEEIPDATPEVADLWIENRAAYVKGDDDVIESVVEDEGGDLYAPPDDDELTPIVTPVAKPLSRGGSRRHG